MIHSLLLTSIAALVLGADDKPPELLVGDSAPKLEVQEFVSGEPIAQFDHGKTYVVEFWATWCGSCREAIPHLTDLQKKHKEATFLGVSIDDDVKAVKPFVANMADKMDYRVAIDAHEGKAGKMSHSWLKASHQDGIPTAYVVNGDGKVAWIGHPEDLAGPLEQILAGKWDLAAAADDFKQKLEAKDSGEQLAELLAKALHDKRYDDALKLADDADAKGIGGDEKPPAGVRRLAVLVVSGNQTEKAVAWGVKLQARSVWKHGDVDPETVVAAIVDPQRILNPRTTLGVEDFHPTPARKVEPELAKLAAASAEEVAMIYADASADVNGFDMAERRLLLARAFQAAGDKEKATREFKKAADSLGGVVRKANEALAAIRTAEKEMAAGSEEDKPRK